MKQKRSKVKAKGQRGRAVAMQEMEVQRGEFIGSEVRAKPFKPMTAAQERYVNAIKSSTITFAPGPAGTGKTYCCTALAAQALLADPDLTLILTRPAQEVDGEEMGFLPGTLEEKYAPYLNPFKSVLRKYLGASQLQYMIEKSKRIKPIPLAYMRGETFDNAWIILDEAQNTKPSTMKMFLTRPGENSRVIVNGDIEQQDIAGKSGLVDALERCYGVPGVSIVNFTNADCVRSDIVSRILRAYANNDSAPIVGEVPSLMVPR